MRVESEKCVGCMACQAMYPETFKVVDGKSTIISEDQPIEPSICVMGAILND